METTYGAETTAHQFCHQRCDLFYKTGCMASLTVTTLALKKQHVVFACYCRFGNVFRVTVTQNALRTEARRTTKSTNPFRFVSSVVC